MAFGVSPAKVSHDLSSAFGKGLQGLKVETMATRPQKSLPGRALAESVLLGVFTLTLAALPVVVTRVPAPESLLPLLELLQDWCTPSICFVVLIVGVLVATSGVWGSDAGSVTTPEQNHKTFTEAAAGYLTTPGPVSATQMDPLRMPDIFFSAKEAAAARAQSQSAAAAFLMGRVAAQPTSVLVPVYYPALGPPPQSKEMEALGPRHFELNDGERFVVEDRFVGERFGSRVEDRFGSPRLEERFSPERFIASKGEDRFGPGRVEERFSPERFVNPQAEEMYVPPMQEMYPEVEERYVPPHGQEMYPKVDERYVPPQGQERYPEADERYVPSSQGQERYTEADERYVPSSQGQERYTEADERYVPSQGQERYAEAEELYVPSHGQETYSEVEEQYVPSQGQERYPEAEERYVPQVQEFYPEVEEQGYESQEQDSRFEAEEDVYVHEDDSPDYLERRRYDSPHAESPIRRDRDDDKTRSSESEDEARYEPVSDLIPLADEEEEFEHEYVESETEEVEPQVQQLRPDVDQDPLESSSYEDDELEPSPPPAPQLPPSPSPSLSPSPSHRSTSSTNATGKPPPVPTPVIVQKNSPPGPVTTNSPQDPITTRPSVLPPRTPPRHANGRRPLASSSSRSYADFVRRTSTFAPRTSKEPPQPVGTTPKTPSEPVKPAEPVELPKGGRTNSTLAGSTLTKQASMPARRPREVMVVDDDKLEAALETQGLGEEDDVDQRVEAFLKNFREQMRLQRQESLQRHRRAL